MEIVLYTKIKIGLFVQVFCLFYLFFYVKLVKMVFYIFNFYNVTDTCSNRTYRQNIFNGLFYLLRDSDL